MTKIDIFSGFLGAGKTTLIKKLIKEAYAGEKLVLIENEFGEIGIDGGFLQDAGINITEMNSGCICCSLVGDFGRALVQVLEEYSPDRIIIEPSGVGKLSDVIRAVQGIERDDIVLNSFTTVCDAGKCRMYIKNFGEFYNDQVEHASAIVLSHTGGMSEDKVTRAYDMIREKNPEAQIITTPWDELDGKTILSAMEGADSLKEELSEMIAHHEHHHHDHEHEHHHDEECHCHEHEHHHNEECHCHDHEHEHHHDEECHCHDHEHEHHHDEECHCHEHEHHHNEECHCHEHGHHHEHHYDENGVCDCGHHHHADEVFTSWGRETAKRYSEQDIKTALAALENEAEYGMVLRAKGIVMSDDGRWIHFDYVPGESDVRYGTASVIGRLCVIGSKLNENAVSELFGV